MRLPPSALLFWSLPPNALRPTVHFPVHYFRNLRSCWQLLAWASLPFRMAVYCGLMFMFYPVMLTVALVTAIKCKVKYGTAADILKHSVSHPVPLANVPGTNEVRRQPPSVAVCLLHTRPTPSRICQAKTVSSTSTRSSRRVVTRSLTR